MKIAHLRLAGQGAWPTLIAGRLSPELNVFFGRPRTGKSTAAQLIAHLLFGKIESDAGAPANAPPLLPEGSLEVDAPAGRYTLRRHRDGSPGGRLSIAAAGGAAVDGRTLRSLLGDQSPRLLGQLYALDFAGRPDPRRLLEGEFARNFAQTLPADAAHDGGPACAQHAHSAATIAVAAPDRRRIDDLIARRDGVVARMEAAMSDGRRASAAQGRELTEVEAGLAERRRRAEDLRTTLHRVEAELASAAMRVRYFGLASAAGRPAPSDEPKLRAQLEALDAEIGRCRLALADMQSRDAAVRRQLAENQSDGTADGAAALGDQRITLGVVERLLDDLEAEVGQLARSHEPGRCVGLDAHARLTPAVQILRQQLYALCGQITEQERAGRRQQLGVEARQLARTQTNLAEQLELLLARRQAMVHASQASARPALLVPQVPAAEHCQCTRHGDFMHNADAVLTGVGAPAREEDAARRRRVELEAERDRLRAAWDAAASEVQQFEARRQQLQLSRAGAADRAALDELRGEWARLEAEIREAVSAPQRPTASPPAEAVRGGVWKASDALAQLTGGKLEQIRVSREGSTAVVVDRGGRALTLEQLGAAQQDQLLLALALALVSSFSSRGLDLPLVLDEPFARQDAAGAAAMAGVLDEFARQGRQVVVFTANDDAARRFESLGAAVRDLDEMRRELAPADAEPVAAVSVASPAGLSPTTPTMRVIRETVDRAKPQLRLAGHWSPDDVAESYFLSADAGLDDFPVLGSDTARVFAGLGIRTVGDLLAADAADVSERLARPSATADAVRLWQAHMSLMCFVPGVSLVDAQVLAANEVNSPEALFTVDVRLLADSIERFLATERGRRFAPSRQRFTRERLTELQKRARQDRDHWYVASRAFSWIDRTASTVRPPATPVAAASRIQRPRSGEKRARPARKPREPSWQFLLHRASPAASAPSIGPRLAERLAAVGIRTVADLLNASPESTAAELGDPPISGAMLARWQQEARLVCRVPGLRAGGARLLAACGFVEPEQIAKANADELFAKVRATCRTKTGKRILRQSPPPSRRRVAEWIQQAARMRPLEAA